MGDLHATTELGVLFLNQGKDAHAQALLEEARRLGGPNATTALGVLFLNQGKDAQAQAGF